MSTMALFPKVTIDISVVDLSTTTMYIQLNYNIKIHKLNV